MTWSCLSTEYTDAVVAVNLRSDQDVRARLELRPQGASVAARVTFEGVDERQVWAACQRAAVVIFEAAIVRASLSTRAPDLHLVVSSCARDGTWLELTGGDARVAFAAAFGEAYAEAALTAYLTRPPVTWSCLSSESTAAVITIDLRSDQGVRARVELRQQDASVAARVTFEGVDERQVWTACQRAAAAIFEAATARASLSARLPDLRLVASFRAEDGTWLELTGGDARAAFVAAFGEAYAEAAP